MPRPARMKTRRKFAAPQAEILRWTFNYHYEYQNTVKKEVLKGHVVDAGSARELYPWMARLGRTLFIFILSMKETDWQN